MSRWGRFTLPVAMTLVVALASPLRAALPDGFNHPELTWYELESAHFVAVFTDGLESTARLALDILEAVHEPTCQFLGAQPDAKTTVVLTDYNDVGFNNFARRMEHVIYLSNPVLNQARIDREAWLRHLLPHEYVHVVNGWALRRYGRAIGPLTEWSGMELQPQWFTEGLAEYFASGQDKSESSFVLQAARQNQLLYGGKLDIADARRDVIETAVVYKQGHSMAIALAERYGEDVFRKIIAAYSSAPQWDIAFKLATGDHIEHFYRVWLARLRDRAAELPEHDPMDDTTLRPTRLEAALGGRPSPDDQTIAVYGVEDWEDPIPGLFLVSADGRLQHKIAGNLDLYDSWKLSWSADSRYLLYTGRSRHRTGSILNSAYIYDVSRKKSWRVDTGDTRLGEAELSPDGSRIAFVHYQDERTMIATMSATGEDVRLLTTGQPFDAFSPTWSPDGQRLAFSLVDADGTDLAIIDADGGGFQRLTRDAWPDQYPAWSPDGQTLAFVSYREPGGHSSAAVSAEAEGLAAAATNIYLLPVAGGEPSQLTTTTSGGAYYPAWSADSQRVLFSLFRVRDAQLHEVPVTARQAAATPVESEPSPFAAQPVTVAVGLTVIRPEAGDVAAAPSATPVAAATTPAQPTAAPVAATASPAAATPAVPVEVQPRRYNSFARTRNYVTRPFNDDDGLGDRLGVRTRWSDPLQQHQFTAEAGYGSGESKQWTGSLEYLNSQTAWTVGAQVFRRVPPLRGERGALVAETSAGLDVMARLPLALGRNAYVQDSLTLGFEVADHQPFSTVGGVLRPAPEGATVAGPRVGFSRTQLFPGRGSHEIDVKVGSSTPMFGADLSYWSVDARYLARIYAPSPRHVLSVGASLDGFTGRDFTRAKAQSWTTIAELQYDWRVADQVLSRYTWPYLHIGPVHLVASYQLRDQLNRNTTGLDLRDRARFELTNEGWVSRNAVYQLRLGPTFYTGANSATDWRAELRFDWRELPF